MWVEARRELTGLPGGGLNIAFEAVGRHALGPKRDRVAIRWLAAHPDGGGKDLSYGELAGLCAGFSHVLHRLGVKPGERVFTLLGRVPELYVAALGAMGAGCVYCPLFSSFGPEPVAMRMELGDARVLVTSEALYRRKVEPIRDRLPGLARIIIADGAADATAPSGTLRLAALMAEADRDFPPCPTSPEDMALLHFTSGTTGRPKGAELVHETAVAALATGRAALDIRASDVYWCTADPGWVTGTIYGIIAPLVIGATVVVDEAEFDPARWCRILHEQKVAVWYTAPTAIRMLMRLGDEFFRQFDFSCLRLAASVGEPLNPEAVKWGLRVLGRPIHDTWWQTETGAIMIANPPGEEPVPGSMGRPLPGIEAAILLTADGGTKEAGTDQVGELAIKTPWPSMFRGYLGDDDRYRQRFHGPWYLSGDLARRDGQGRFWFVGRADDVIKSAGHLVSPFEVESFLLRHPAVVEAGVIGKPDTVAGQLVKAFVSLKSGYIASETLARELVAFARRGLGAALAPREIDFLEGLPRTRSGKIMRRILKARELGLDEGDTSTLEGNGEKRP